MIGIIILTHGRLADEFLKTALMIGLSSDERISAVSVDPVSSPESLRETLERIIREVDDGNGVLILTDLFGGTPTNLSLSFLAEGKVEVVTGLNLPMIIKAVNSRYDHDVRSLASMTADAGKENIYLAGDVLRQRMGRRNSG
jgi:PTS system mannose-specific IIA component